MESTLQILKGESNMAEIKSLLDDAIEKEIENLDSISDGEKKSQAIRDLVQLHGLRIDEIKAQTEAEEKRERRRMDGEKNEADLNLKRQQTESQIEQGDRELALKEQDAADKAAGHDREALVAEQQIRENKVDRYVKVGMAAAELVLPLAFYGIWMGKGFEFEKTGSFTSTTFKNLLNRFRPTK